MEELPHHCKEADIYEGDDKEEEVHKGAGLEDASQGRS